MSKFNPLVEEEVINNRPNDVVQDAEFTEIPEAGTTKPPNMNVGSGSFSGGGNSNVPPNMNGGTTNNNSNNSEDEGTTTAEAAAMADAIIAGYVQGKRQLGGLVKIGEKKINKLSNENGVDFSSPVPESPESRRTIPLINLINKFNNSLNETFDTSDDFKKAVKPPLIEELKKRDLGMSPMTQIIFHVSMDLFVAVATGIKQRNDMINVVKDNFSNTKRQPIVGQTAAPNNVTTEPTKERKEPEETANVTVNTAPIETVEVQPTASEKIKAKRKYNKSGTKPKRKSIITEESN